MVTESAPAAPRVRRRRLPIIVLCVLGVGALIAGVVALDRHIGRPRNLTVPTALAGETRLDPADLQGVLDAFTKNSTNAHASVAAVYGRHSPDGDIVDDVVLAATGYTSDDTTGDLDRLARSLAAGAGETVDASTRRTFHKDGTDVVCYAAGGRQDAATCWWDDSEYVGAVLVVGSRNLDAASDFAAAAHRALLA